LSSADGANILSLARIMALLAAVHQLRSEAVSGLLKALIITGNEKFFPPGPT
jgi:hypothetical protein